METCPTCVVGADLNSRKLAFARVCIRHDPSVFSYEPPKRITDRAEILQILFRVSEEVLYNYAATVLYIEEALVGRNVRGSMMIAHTVGTVMASATGMERVYQVPVSTWKKATVGRGHATKDDVRDWLLRTHPETASLCGDDQDKYDAAAIALYGQGIQWRVDDISHDLSGHTRPA